MCDVQITVTGPVHRLQEVQRFLGVLNDFTTLLTDFDETLTVNTLTTVFQTLQSNMYLKLNLTLQAPTVTVE